MPKAAASSTEEVFIEADDLGPWIEPVAAFELKLPIERAVERRRSLVVESFVWALEVVLALEAVELPLLSAETRGGRTAPVDPGDRNWLITLRL